MQILGLEEKKAQTESSVDNSLWATAHYEAWSRIAALQKLLKKLAKYAQCNVLDIVKTVLKFWYDCGFSDHQETIRRNHKKILSVKISFSK